jgi:hypothetical protein
MFNDETKKNQLIKIPESAILTCHTHDMNYKTR